MKFPEGLKALSKHYKLIVPEAVSAEIKKSPGKELLRDMVRENIVTIEKVNLARTTQIQNEYPQLHTGECEVIAFAESRVGPEKVILLSDDRVARNKFPNLNFKWTEELMEHMKVKGIIDPNTYDKKLNELQKSPFYYKGRMKN
jgi:predicted nucleic acid-binding protein